MLTNNVFETLFDLLKLVNQTKQVEFKLTSRFSGQAVLTMPFPGYITPLLVCKRKFAFSVLFITMKLTTNR